MSSQQTLEQIGIEALLVRVSALHKQGYRLVQINASTLPECYEINYSFDKDSALVTLRVLLPLPEPRLPSISSIYWAAFIYENEMHDLFGIHISGMAIDFAGQFYNTSVKYAFGSTKPPQTPTETASSAAPATTATVKLEPNANN